MQKRPHASVVFCTCFCQDIQNNITFPKLVVQRLPVIISTDFQCFLYIYRYTRICIFTYVYPYISLYSPIPLTLISICWALGIIYNPPAPLVPPDCGEPCCIAYLCGSSTRAFSLYGTSGPGASNVLPRFWPRPGDASPEHAARLRLSLHADHAFLGHCLCKLAIDLLAQAARQR